MIDTKLIREMAQALKPDTGTTPYDTEAEVVRVEGNTAWVHIPGGIAETPVDMTINAKEGDKVRVRVSGGQAWVSGNDTAPPTDDTKAKEAEGKADEANERAYTATESAEQAAKAADDAQKFANTAQASADNANEYAARALGNLSTVQSVVETLAWITQHGTMTLTTDTEPDPTHVYFVVDANGDYIVDSTHYSVVTEPKAADMASYYVLSIDESLNNYVATHLALTNEGLWILPASTGYKVLIATGAGTTYTTAGTYIIDQSGATVATFGPTAVLGEDGKAHISVNSYKLTVYDYHGANAVSEIGSRNTGTNGTATIIETLMTDTFKEIGGVGYFGAVTSSTPDSIVSCTVDGSSVTAYIQSGYKYIYSSSFDMVTIATITYTTRDTVSYAAFNDSDATGVRSFASGHNSIAQGRDSAAFGENARAIGQISFAEGNNTNATGECSHAEGVNSNGAGYDSHAEGYGTTASGRISHAEGERAVASGRASHAQNYYTIASSDYQTAMGKYNVEDDNDQFVLIIGNGEDAQNRSDAFRFGFDGTIWFDTDSSEGIYNAIVALGWQEVL